MSQQNRSEASQLLRDLNWLPHGTKVVNVAIAGAGNMNLVERVSLDNGTSLILKRAQGWVEKYPHIPAPVGRAAVEAAFYAAVAGSSVGAKMPTHLGFDERNAANLLQDLGECTDGMTAYAGTKITDGELDAVADWAAGLHVLPLAGSIKNTLNNRAMRELNAVHIFDFPLAVDNGFDLEEITPGLQAAANVLQTDRDFIAAVQPIKALYLGDAPDGVLLHGDLYPGSWLNTSQGLFMIDPEFCWLGPREWDVGMVLAHLRLSQQPAQHSARFIRRYGQPIDRALANKVAGIEIMRRLLGVAQLPISMDCSAKITLLHEARALVLGISP